MSRGNGRLPAAGQSQDGATAAQRGGAKWVVTSLDDVIFVVVAVVVGWPCSCPPVCVYSSRFSARSRPRLALFSELAAV